MSEPGNPVESRASTSGSGSLSGTEGDGAPPPALAAVAARIFGDRLPLAVRYAGMLMTHGVERGLLGPHEATRVWDRHLLNCAVIAELIPEGAIVADVGTGAGLPGIVLAVARPDLSISLIDSQERRTVFLTEVVEALALERTTVVRGRAEDLRGREPVDVVTARAVAPLDRLARWCLPLTAVGGRVLALKGESAGAEVAEYALAISRQGGGMPMIYRCGDGVVDEPTTVVEIVRERAVGPPGRNPGVPRRRGGRDRGRGRP